MLLKQLNKKIEKAEQVKFEKFVKNLELLMLHILISQKVMLKSSICAKSRRKRKIDYGFAPVHWAKYTTY